MICPWTTHRLSLSRQEGQKTWKRHGSIWKIQQIQLLLCSRILCRIYKQAGFKDLPWRTQKVEFVLYLYLAAAETMNGSPQGIWSPDWKKHTSLPPNWTELWGWPLSLRVVSRRWKDAVRLECWGFVISASKYLFESKMSHWIMRSYQLDQFGLGKVYIFSQKCVFAEEMCFWIPVDSLNKSHNWIVDKKKLHWSSLIKTVYWEYEVPNVRWPIA